MMKSKLLIISIFLLAIIFLIISSTTSGNVVKIVRCSDTDGVRDYNKAGTVVMEYFREGVAMTEESSDYCAESTLYEYFCSDNTLKKERYRCPQGCENGACVHWECIDSDATTDYPDGKNYYLRGYVDYYSEITIDACSDNDTLSERFCNSVGEPATEEYACAEQCLNGACLGEPTEKIITTCADEAIIIKLNEPNHIILSFPSKDIEKYNEYVDLPAFYFDERYHLGESTDKPLFTDETKDIFVDGNEYFLVSDHIKKESYLMQIANLNAPKDKITFREVLSGREYEVDYVDNNKIDDMFDGNFTIGSTLVNFAIYDASYAGVEDSSSAFLRVDMNADNELDNEDVPFYTRDESEIRLHAETGGDLADEIEITEPAGAGCRVMIIPISIDYIGEIEIGNPIHR